jgi:hypothetical protein
VQYSYESIEPYYLSTGFRVVLTQQLQEALDVRAIVGRDRLDYRQESASGQSPDSRTDRANVLGGGVGYRLQPNLRLGLDVEFANRTSERIDRRYDRTRVFASMTYGF